MPNISAEFHQRILRALDDALQDVKNVAETSKVMTGQQQIEDRLKRSREAVEQSKERSATIERLTTLDQGLRIHNSGPMAPAVTRSRANLAKLIKELERG